MRGADPQRLEGERQLHGLEVAVRDQRVALDQDHRVVADAVQLDLHGVLGGRHLLAIGAVHLRSHPERERILHRQAGRGVVQIRALEQRAHLGGRRDLAGDRLGGGRGRVERARVAAHGLQRERAGQVGQDREPQGLLRDERPRSDGDAVGARRARALPSAARRSASRPARASASAAGSSSPLSSASPLPIMTTAIAAMCMRSPAPTEPALGTIGCTPALSIATSNRTASSVRPEPPRAAPLTRASIEARTSSVSSAGPMPLAWAWIICR